MGRHNKRPATDHDVRDKDHIKDGRMSKAAARRIGLYKYICQKCNARNPEGANKCRKCGNTDLRPKKRDYTDA